MVETAALEIGQAAPDFGLKGPGGQVVSLADYRGRNHVVLVFYPLAFSPVCSHQLPMIDRALARITARGGVVLGVSVDSHWANTAFAERLSLSFPLLSDFDRKVSAAYGVLNPERGFSERAVFVIDRQGRIAYRDVSPSPSEIPDNEAMIAALEGLQ
ncbi:MAG: redoxin domain-containing protein [Candidatus Eiseniibacteriota bacterium]